MATDVLVEQEQRVAELTDQLVSQYPGATVSGHRDWSDAKACPSFDAKAWWSE
jgi:hypothetical protein